MTPRVAVPAHLRNVPFSLAEGRAAGLGSERLRGRDLARPFRGVRSLSEPTSIFELCAAFSTTMPDDAYFSCVTAALLHGAPLPLGVQESRTLHVARPAPSDPLESRGVRGHAFDHIAGRIQRYRGLRVASPVTTWCQLGSEISLPDLIAVGDFYIFRDSPMCSRGDLIEAVNGYAGRRGIRNLREAVGLLDDNVRSRHESLFRFFLIRAGFSGFITNYPVTVFARNHVIDIAFPSIKVALEYDGDYHREKDEWRRTMTRRARLEAAGWRVMQLNADDLNDPVELAARLRAFLASNPA